MTSLGKRLSTLALLVGVLGTSFSSIIIKGSTSPPAIIAAYRLGLTVLLLLPPAVLVEKLHRFPISRKDLVRSVISGGFLAVHFLSWITSLQHTSVASSVALVSSHTLFIMAYTRITTRKRFPAAAVMAIAVAWLGTAIIGIDGWRTGPQELLGDALALIGALGMAGYCVLGERVRKRVGVLSYAVLVYASASALLLLFCVLSGIRLWPYAHAEWRIFWALALIPTVLGHTLFNWALKHVPARTVSAATLGEPVGAAVLAFVILKETPGFAVVIGGFLVVGGLIAFLRSDNQNTEALGEPVASSRDVSGQ